MKYNLGLFVICIELILCIVGTVFIIKRKFLPNKVLGIQKISYIKKENLYFPPDSKLQFYHTLKPNITEIQHPSWLPSEAIYTYNSDGLNDRFDYSIEKESDVFRIITLGDSFTFGHYVTTANNWTENLEDLLNKYSMKNCSIKKIEVINLGMRGFDIPYIVERYKTIGTKYKPDLIIWFESGTGIKRVNEIALPLIKSCEENMGNSQSQPEKLYKCWYEIEEQIQNKYSINSINNYFKNYINDFLMAIGSTRVIFYTFSNLNHKRCPLQSWIDGYSGIKFSPIIPPLKNDDLLPDSHSSINGHIVIAKAIFNDLKDNFLSKCF